MIKPDWDVFKAKFSENPQKNFEWFCYLLFCEEHGGKKGFHKYKNQPAIETDPITFENEVIAWQAKFYNTTLSDRKEEIINTIKESKNKYPEITNLYFYTNTSWSQYKGQEPRGKIEAEEKAKDLGIKIEWRTAGFFESPFVSLDNEQIAKYFFTIEKNIFESIEKLKKHTENILDGVKTEIKFNGETIEIDRNNEINKINNSENKIIIVTGASGVGKTALIKKYYNKIKGKIPFYLFEALEFDVIKLKNYFDLDFDEFLDAHKNDSEKIIVIDSAEKLSDIKNKTYFKEYVNRFVENNWKVIFTTRNNYINELENYNNFDVTEIIIKNIEENEIVLLAKKYSFIIPNDNKIINLIRIPFYLNELLKNKINNKDIDYIEFKNKIWNNTIKKENQLRTNCFIEFAFERACKCCFFVDCLSNYDANIFKSLIDDGIICYEEGKGYFISHDIYEKWAIEKKIELKFNNKKDNKDFFESIGNSVYIRKYFRNWISEKLLLEKENIKNFINNVVTDSEIDSCWRDEILISVLLSEYSNDFFQIFKEIILLNIEYEKSLFNKIIHLLKTACIKNENNSSEKNYLKLFSYIKTFKKPKGNGWIVFIKFVYDNIEEIKINNIKNFIEILYIWNTETSNNETIKYSAKLALNYYEYINENTKININHNLKNYLLSAILFGAYEIKNEFDAILKKKLLIIN